LAFTIPELMISVAILGIIAVASLLALSSDNQIAAVNRYLLSAKTLAQSRIDEALSVSYHATGPVPAVLAEGKTANTVVISNSSPPLTGTMTTTVVVSDPALALRRIAVSVNYSFGGRPYEVTLASARAPD
jgi:prepilin-type N-terminal cleavage/methylation domain-containing protein